MKKRALRVRDWGYRIKEWLRYRAGVLLLATVCAGLWAMVLALYRLPLAAVGYASLLCGCLLAAAGVADFLRFSRRHRRLVALQQEITIGPEGLPVPHNLLEKDYATLLKCIHADKIERISEADRAESDRKEYDTMWAHQIKTPIAAMRLLLQNEDSPQNRDLQAELFSIEQYVGMVLTYSRLDSDQSDLVIRSCPLTGLVRQAVHKYAPLFVRKKIRLEWQPMPGNVLTDEKWLVFVIEQLLSNALKYTPQGGTITIRQASPDTLVIADTGIGIAPEDLPRLGEKGFTGYNGRADKKATGLGLYLCRRILDRLAHRMVITSQVGQGTSVTLLLSREPLEVRE